MKILGGIEMSKVDKTKLVFQNWSNPKDCRTLLANPTQETVMSLIKKEFEFWERDLNDVSFSIWVGSNAWQGYFCGGSNSDDLDGNDTNIVGDAAPDETLWIVFEEDEWAIIERDTGIKVEEILRPKWERWVAAFEGNEDSSYVTEYLEKVEFIMGYEDIIGANIEIKLR